MSHNFTATQDAFNNGIENTSPAAGASLAGEWAGELRKADFPGAQAICANLERLETTLSADQPDLQSANSILEELCEATAKAADSAQDRQVGDQVRSLAQAMGSKTTA